MLAKRIKFMAVWIFLIPFAMMGFAGCGGGGGSSSDVTSSPIGGIAVDPYIAEAVFEEIPAEGGSPLQVSTPSDKNGYFTFSNPLTPGSTIQMKLGAQGKHNNVPYAGILKRVVDEEGTLVISPLTTLAANGLFTEEVVALLDEAGLTGLTEEDVTADPMAGLTDLTEFSAEDLIPLQASLAVNAFFSIMNNYGMDCDEAFADSDRLAEMVAMVKEAINENVLNSILINPQARMNSVSSVGFQMTLGPAINASVNITDTVVSKVKKDPTIDPVSEAGFLMAYHSDLAMRYYVQQNRGRQDVEEAIAIGDLPDVQEDEIPAISENGDIVEIAPSVADTDADQGIYDDIETSNVISPPAPAPRPDGSLVVFPGAEGFGTETPAGRGGKIIKVTNLNDSGTGSLRAAIDTSGPRIIVFEVGGQITLSSDLKISNPFVTIAGQTAPSPGITLKGAGIRVSTHDVLVQHLRIRVGDDPNGPSPSNRDALQIPTPGVYNVVVDHVSASWAIDENMSTWYEMSDITFSNCIISEGLHNSLHPEGAHSKGLLVGTGAKNISVIGNLIAHNHERFPRINGSTSAVVVNNLMYDAGNGYEYVAIGSSDGPTIASLVGNVFINGPSSPAGMKAIKVQSVAPAGTKVYQADNSYPGTIYSGSSSATSNTSPFDLSSITIRKSSAVESWVLSNAGSRPVNRDSVDERIVHETITRTGWIIDSPGQVGGWPNLPKTVRAFVIPDNPNGDDDGDGYTNIEEVLHQMAAEVEGAIIF
jgi:hypothetical protein